jgi:hypothetical protein
MGATFLPIASSSFFYLKNKYMFDVGFFIDMTLPAALWPWVESASNSVE